MRICLYRAVSTLCLGYKNQSMYSGIITVCSENHIKHINTLCGLNGELFEVKYGEKYGNDWALKGLNFLLGSDVIWCVVRRVLSVKLYSGTTQKKIILTYDMDLLVVGIWVKGKAGKMGSTVHTPPGIFFHFRGLT